jgi:hypothetical protein
VTEVPITLGCDVTSRCFETANVSDLIFKVHCCHAFWQGIATGITLRHSLHASEKHLIFKDENMGVVFFPVVSDFRGSHSLPVCTSGKGVINIKMNLGHWQNDTDRRK